jgi:alkylation response protein AidB-like acyl-CoA dehydrogenase
MQHLASYCLTEPGSGSDAASLSTRAERSGNTYLINGSKAFISGGGVSDLYVCMVRTGEPGSKGISCILVEADTPGLSFGAPEKKLGWKSQPTAMVMFEDCRVPVNNRIGEEGQGFRIAMAGLDGGRLNIAACSIGGAQFCLDRAILYMRERRQFGTRLADFQALGFRIADFVTELEAARRLLRRAAWAMSTGERGRNASCRPGQTPRHRRWVRKRQRRARTPHGGYGYLRDHPIERVLRDVRVHQVLEGTNEVMRLIIGRDVLGNCGRLGLD